MPDQIEFALAFIRGLVLVLVVMVGWLVLMARSMRKRNEQELENYYSNQGDNEENIQDLSDNDLGR